MDKTITICGHPVWSTNSCKACDSCFRQLEMHQKVLSAAQDLVAFYDNRGTQDEIKERVTRLRSALDYQ